MDSGDTEGLSGMSCFRVSPTSAPDSRQYLSAFWESKRRNRRPEPLSGDAKVPKSLGVDRCAVPNKEHPLGPSEERVWSLHNE